MTTFDEAFEHLMALEGFESNNAADSGGYTRYGITADTWLGMHGNHPPKPLNEITRADAKEFYFKHFWVKYQIDRLERIAPLAAFECFESGVNCGPAVAVRFLQTALNFLFQSGLVVDGRLGSKTLAAVQDAIRRPGMELLLVSAQNCEQYAHYKSICEQYPKNLAFVRGWMKRVVVNA